MLTILGLILCLLIVLWQDWRFRRIHVVLPLSVFALAMYQTHNIVTYKEILLNIFFFLIVLAFLVVYMSIKSKKILNPFHHYFGLGDALFYIAIAPLFGLKQFAIYFIASMVFAVIMQLSFKKYIKESTVPLAGFSALLLVLIMVSDLSFNFNKLTLI